MASTGKFNTPRRQSVHDYLIVSRPLAKAELSNSCMFKRITVDPVGPDQYS